MSYHILSKEKAIEFFSEFYGGEHHIPGRIKPHGFGWCVNQLGGLSTFDYDNLTHIVVLAHKHLMRVEVMQGGPGRLKIAITQRKADGAMYERHRALTDLKNYITKHES